MGNCTLTKVRKSGRGHLEGRDARHLEFRPQRNIRYGQNVRESYMSVQVRRQCASISSTSCAVWGGDEGKRLRHLILHLTQVDSHRFPDVEAAIQPSQLQEASCHVSRVLSL
jgi:hypothetical protein